MIDILYKILYWFPMILYALIKWQTLFFVCRHWKEYKTHLRFKKLLLIAGSLALIIAAFYTFKYIKKGNIWTM
jgi:hypothetical protein